MSRNVFDDMMKDYKVKKTETAQIRLGETEIGTAVTMGPRQMGHTLISGMSRSGKSTMVKFMLEDMVKIAEVAIWSPKAQDYAKFAKGAYVNSDVDAFRGVLRRTVGELEKRNRASWKASMKKGDTVEDNSVPMYIVIDEFATFIKQCGEGAKIALERLIAEGAGMNIFLVLISQTAHKKIYDNGIKDSMMTTIAFKAQNDYASRLAIGSKAAMFLDLHECIVKNVDKEYNLTKFA